MEENKTVVEVAAVEATPAVEETKKSVLNASVAPENFDWDAFESEDVYGGGDIAAIEEQYNQTLSKVVEGEVVEGYSAQCCLYERVGSLVFAINLVLCY